MKMLASLISGLAIGDHLRTLPFGFIALIETGFKSVGENRLIIKNNKLIKCQKSVLVKFKKFTKL